jgi:hypothetical protein
MRARSLLAGVLAILCSLGVSPASGQSVGKMVVDDFKNFGGDVWSVWTSPFRARPMDWLYAGAVVGGSAAFMPIDDNIDRWMVDNKSKFGFLKEVREGGAGFTGKYVTLPAGALLVYGIATKNQKIQDGVFGCGASYMSGTLLRNYVLYPLISRDRPSPVKGAESPPAVEGDQYEISFPGHYGRDSAAWGTHSLPAGHAANIISCVSFLNNRFEMGVAEPILYIVSAGVGLGRIVDRRHWTSDTFIGMAFGYAIGKEVARRSSNRAAARATTVGVAPGPSLLSKAYVDAGPKGITFGWKTTF